MRKRWGIVVILLLLEIFCLLALARWGGGYRFGFGRTNYNTKAARTEALERSPVRSAVQNGDYLALIPCTPDRPCTNVLEDKIDDPTIVACVPGHDVRTSDLCAQWKAADAAADSAKWTFWALMVNIPTLIFVAVTLIDTRRSTRAALRALSVGHAALVPDKCLVRVKIAKGRGRNNPVLSPSVEVSCDWLNVGERPALQVASRIRVISTLGAGIGDEMVGYEAKQLRLEYGETFTTNIVLSPPLVERVLKDEWKIVIASEIGYIDRLSPHKPIQKKALYSYVKLESITLDKAAAYVFDAKHIPPVESRFLKIMSDLLSKRRDVEAVGRLFLPKK